MPVAVDDKRKQARDAARKARTMAAKLEAAAGIRSDAERKRESRAGTKDCPIPRLTPDDREWRELLEAFDADWLRYFFPDPPYGFWYDFTPQQQAMIDAIAHAIKHGGDQAIAASRGEGKTQIARRLTLKYVLSGRVRFAVLFAATAADAGDSLQAIRSDLEDNDLLARYYPEVCVPVRALENTPNRAHYQTVTGQRHDTGEPFERVPSRFSWCGHEVSLPNVPGSPSAGAIIATRGLDSAVRGLNKKGRRPDVAIIDDPDTEETARSPEQATKLETRIDRAIAGLGGQQRSIARVMLTTLQNRICASFKFTDPTQKSTWQGKRFRFLLKPPDRRDLWDEYVQMVGANHQARDASGEPSDPFARGAHRFYLEHRAEMDAGATVANPHRYDPADLGDGTTLEVSALQRYYNMVARVGVEAVATEYDNDPPEESGDRESGITPHRVQNQLSGFPAGLVPPKTIKITQGIDVGKILLYWVVRAWQADGTGHTIAYGTQAVHGTAAGSDVGVDEAIKTALRERHAAVLAQPYLDSDGTPHAVDLTLVDSGYQTEAIYAYCREAGLGWRPCKGDGDSPKYQRKRFIPVLRAGVDRRPGDGWNDCRQQGGIWLCELDANGWKSWEHARWMTDPDTPGAMLLWGSGPDAELKVRGRLSEDQKAHKTYAKQICNEVEIEEVVKGVLIRRWRVRPGTNKANDYLDASVYSDVAASMEGVPLLGRRAGSVRPVLKTMALGAMGGKS